MNYLPVNDNSALSNDGYNSDISFNEISSQSTDFGE